MLRFWLVFPYRGRVCTGSAWAAIEVQKWTSGVVVRRSGSVREERADAHVIHTVVNVGCGRDCGGHRRLLQTMLGIVVAVLYWRYDHQHVISGSG